MLVPAARLVLAVALLAAAGLPAAAAAGAAGAAGGRSLDRDVLAEAAAQEAPRTRTNDPAYDFPAFNEGRAAFEGAFLEAQQRTLWPPERELLGRLMPEGPAVVLDVGCGPGHLAERVLEAFPAARVVCLEISFAHCDEARRRLRRHVESGRLRVVQGDAARAGEAVRDGSVDLAVARLVLQHVKDPAEVVRAMARAVRPGGGRVLLLDADEALVDFVDPPIPGMDELVEANEEYEESVRRFRSDVAVGRHVQRFLRDAGLGGVRRTTVSVTSEDEGFDMRGALPMFDATLFRHLPAVGFASARRVELVQRVTERLFLPGGGGDGGGAADEDGGGAVDEDGGGDYADADGDDGFDDHDGDDDADADGFMEPYLAFHLVAAWGQRGESPGAAAAGRDEL